MCQVFHRNVAQSFKKLQRNMIGERGDDTDSLRVK